jgi:peptidyl-prolyl cis-trans isomerase B (cyclophilin B)
VANNRREREAARRRYERRQQRLAEQRARRRRRNSIVGITMVVLLLLAGGISWAAVALTSDNDKHTLAAPTPTATPTPKPTATPVACGAKRPAPPRHESFPHAPKLTIDKHAHYTMRLATSCGPIVVALDAAKAPQTVNSLNFLAAHRFYDGTFCHRMTTGASLTVLQCGDPLGTGAGGPGYTLPEENLKGAKYSRGVVAMAKTQAPHSTGSQFFLIDKNSQLPPQYTVVGRITTGLRVLDHIIAIGNDGSNGPGDGAPKKKVYLTTVRVTKH